MDLILTGRAVGAQEALAMGCRGVDMALGASPGVQAGTLCRTDGTGTALARISMQHR